mmetsp:Transcript_12823/g.19695  ORF Transcript_12823/g.19695 Transcript_12823/m.19695 type:complete len:162 (+) Transcript_12823:74-559(+)|eukprot:CAMPEP_0201517412 /NCGR_PEP_ID=MMETSP0161_2-20130828/8524_1 /ASSEMBLY_ACC=CAM_ASM_000251 /TAXON_ID=180227 /ORGANISM="Neoparamoeba aestuarina, Strain SoJaBio B1-5/56/2" /LENGTH=161 /DNA_ID=CAMNT_0047914907 /DNA_START=130 /DNA_END=615 /DNA_ORIENTATION=+
MPHSFGKRARTRDLFSKPFRQHGSIKMSNYLTVYKVGDIVDIKADGAIQKGMPHKYYHGKTGRVWNVTKSAVGVEVSKTVGNRIIKKRLHVRVEHVSKSASRQAFLERVKENDKKRAAAKENKEKCPSLRRLPPQPRGGELVKTNYNNIDFLFVPEHSEIM